MANAAKLKKLEGKLEAIKLQEYECPGPTEEASEELLDKLELAIQENAVMNYMRCIELECEQCDFFKAHDEKVLAIEDEIDELYESDS